MVFLYLLLIFFPIAKTYAMPIIVGMYESNEKTAAAILSYPDNGTSVKTYVPWADPNIQNSGLSDISCNKNHTCITTGWYEDRNNLSEGGVIFASVDDGVHWTGNTPLAALP